MKAIVACDKNWGIGKGNDLLFHLPGDMAYFRKTTKGGIIIIGRRTLESFPDGRPLPDRVNIVITRNKDYQAEDCIVIHPKRRRWLQPRLTLKALLHQD